MENSTTFEIEAGYFLELLTPGKMKLLGSIKSNIKMVKLVRWLRL